MGLMSSTTLRAEGPVLCCTILCSMTAQLSASFPTPQYSEAGHVQMQQELDNIHGRNDKCQATAISPKRESNHLPLHSIVLSTP